MRTNIVLNDDLVNQAMQLTDIKTKRELVDYSLRELTREHQQPIKPTLAQAFAVLRELNQDGEDIFPELPRHNRSNTFAEELN